MSTNPSGPNGSINTGPLPAGTRAPDFKLPTTPDQRVSLSDFRGQPTVLFFYPADWSPVCGDQTALYNELLPEFRRFNAALLGVSVDGVWCHSAYATQRKLHYPLLSDFEPKGQVARAYGVYRQSDGISERALFVINSEGVIHWSYLSPIGVNPGADGILNALEDLATKREPQLEEKRCRIAGSLYRSVHATTGLAPRTRRLLCWNTGIMNPALRRRVSGC